MSDADTHPRQSARTRRFTLGEPRSFTVAADGDRLFFLRSASGTDARTGLWAIDLPAGVERLVADPAGIGDADLPPEERARRERMRETASGVVAYSVDAAGTVAVFALAGDLHAVDVADGTTRVVATAGPAFDPRVDPSGRRVAYATGRALRCVDIATGEDRLLADDATPDVYWGRAEHVAGEEMGRHRGFWWAPDGESLLATRVDESMVRSWWIGDPAHPDRAPQQVRYPAAGTPNAVVSLHHIRLGKSPAPREIRWDSAALPYLARVSWGSGGPPLLQVQSRDQRRLLTLSVDVEAGATEVLAEDVDPIWVELVDGVPAWSRRRLVRVVDRDDARRLVVGDEVVTPPGLHVRAVVSADDDGVVLTASYDDPTQVHVLRWSHDGAVERLTTSPGVHSAVAASGLVVIGAASLDHDGLRHHVRSAAGETPVRSVAERPLIEPKVQMVTLGPDALRAGIVLPRDHTPGQRLPVLLDPYGGPHAQRVVSARRAWLDPQWLADQGFAVLVVDGRGTPGRGSAWERAISGDLSVVLDDQVTALHAAAELQPDLDLSRVAIRGWSFGGYLAALAVLRRPDIFSAAVAGAPVTDWALYDTHYSERYLGEDLVRDAAAYERSSLLGDAARLSRPLLIVHGLADDNVVAAHSLLLSQRLTEAGRPHGFLPLVGVTHMTPQEEVAENLLLMQVEFLRQALAAG